MKWKDKCGFPGWFLRHCEQDSSWLLFEMRWEMNHRFPSTKDKPSCPMSGQSCLCFHHRCSLTPPWKVDHRSPLPLCINVCHYSLSFSLVYPSTRTTLGPTGEIQKEWPEISVMRYRWKERFTHPWAIVTYCDEYCNWGTCKSFGYWGKSSYGF